MRGILLNDGPWSSGVGFGICQRLLNNLSQKFPPDAEPQFKSLFPGKAPQDTAPTESYDGLTLILACRSEKKALDAKRTLLRRLDRRIALEKKKPGYDGHAERFRANLEINFHCVDMSVASSTFKFCQEIRDTCVVHCCSVQSADALFLRADTLISHISSATLAALSGQA